MAYQNINQYNFRKWGIKPVNEITDICLASDERDYDQEVVFSPFLIGINDGNRMPFRFDFNSSGTTLCQTSACSFDYQTIVSENYWNPDDIDPNFCPKVTELCDVGLTGIDNGLVQNMSGETIEITTGLYTNQSDKFSRYKYDRRMKLHPITGFTTTENRLWDDNSYSYDLSFQDDGGDVGYVAKLNGGFFQGFYKVPGYDYQVFPQRVPLGWTMEVMLRYRWTGDTSVGLNARYPDNKGTFFYMGSRAENKFYHYADGHPVQDTGYTRVTSGLTCMHTCGCASTANTSSDCMQVYQPSGGTITHCTCGCPCNCDTKAKYPEKDPLYDGVSNALSLRLSGDSGNPRLCVKTYRITGGCESTGTCLTGLTYVTGTSVTEWCSTRGIFDVCTGTTYSDIEHWVQIDAVFERYEWFDTCDLYDKGGLGLLVKDVYFATLENRSVSLIEPPITREQPYDPASTEVVTFNDMWTEEQKYRLGTLKFYVNGKLFMVTENFEEIIPRLLNVEKEKQIGVGYNISIGGGTQGLHDNLTFSGGCPETIDEIVYQQDPECLTTYDLDHTIYSGLTTQVKLEEYFGGSMIGDISAFRMYTEPLNASQIKHNFRILENKYDLLNPDCPNCRIPLPTPSATQTPTVTPTPTSTFIPSPSPTHTSTPTSTTTPSPTPGGFNRGPFTFDFDYMLCEYYFTDGSDMDTLTYMSVPPIMSNDFLNNLPGDYVGTCAISSNGPQFPNNGIDPQFLLYGGDNRNSFGYEAVLFDLSSFKTEYPLINNIELEFTATWYVNVGLNPVFMRATLWKGGTPIGGVSGCNSSGFCTEDGSTYDYTFTNPTATSTYLVESNGKVITSNLQVCEPFESVSTFTYNLSTFNGSFS